MRASTPALSCGWCISSEARRTKDITYAQICDDVLDCPWSACVELRGCLADALKQSGMVWHANGFVLTSLSCASFLAAMYTFAPF